MDEIQRCPEILSAIKMAVDKNRAAGQFILTGSANVLTTLPKVSESPAGSMEVGRLRPLSRGEILGVKETFVERLCAEEFALPTNFPIEVKSSLTVNRHDFKGLHLLADSVPKKFRRGIVLYTGNQFLAFGENLFAVPIQALWK